MHLLTDRRMQPCVYSTALSAFVVTSMPLMNSLTKSLLAAAPVALVAACGSAPTPAPDDTAAAAPMVYVSSLRSPSSIATCLEDRLPRVRASQAGGATELAVGSSSNASYLVTLTPSGNGSVVRVMHDPSASSDPPEEEMRFHIARCTI
ncbi:sugar ABC transporter ATPase [Paraburkholderia caballeronis]|nr:sugar ABC transporter ATPase [Paraburkholderia caballeronis]